MLIEVRTRRDRGIHCANLPRGCHGFPLNSPTRVRRQRNRQRVGSQGRELPIRIRQGSSVLTKIVNRRLDRPQTVGPFVQGAALGVLTILRWDVMSLEQTFAEDCHSRSECCEVLIVESRRRQSPLRERATLGGRVWCCGLRHTGQYNFETWTAISQHFRAYGIFNWCGGTGKVWVEIVFFMLDK